MGFPSVPRDMGQLWSMVVSSDASAAFGVTVGKVAQCAIVLGSDNSADVCSKGLNAKLMTKHVSLVDGRCSAGGATLCPAVLGIWDSVRSSSRMPDSGEQCCMLMGRDQREHCASNQSINQLQGSRRGHVLGTALTCSVCVFTSPSSPVHLTLTRHHRHSVLRCDSFKRACVVSRSRFARYRKQSPIIHSAHFPQPYLDRVSCRVSALCSFFANSSAFFCCFFSVAVSRFASLCFLSACSIVQLTL